MLIVASLGVYFLASFTTAGFCNATKALQLAGKIGEFSQTGEDGDGKDHLQTYNLGLKNPSQNHGSVPHALRRAPDLSSTAGLVPAAWSASLSPSSAGTLAASPELGTLLPISPYARLLIPRCAFVPFNKARLRRVLYEQPSPPALRGAIQKAGDMLLHRSALELQAAATVYQPSRRA